MKKKKLSLDRELLTKSMQPPDRRIDAASGTETSIWSVLISLLLGGCENESQ